MPTIRAEIKANICSIALELKYNNQVLHCMKVSTLKTNFLIITRFFIVFFFIEKSKESYLVVLEENLRCKHFGCSPLSRYYNFVNLEVYSHSAHLCIIFSYTGGTKLSYTVSSFNCISTSSSHLLHYVSSFLFVFPRVYYYLTLPYFLFHQSYILILSHTLIPYSKWK